MFVASALLIAACTSNPKSHEAEVTEAQEVQEVTTEANALAINKDESTVTWLGTKPTGRHGGTIGISEGEVFLKDGTLSGANFVLDMNSIATEDFQDNEEMYNKLVGHLKSPDFFDVENHPTAKFEMTSVKDYVAGDEAEESEESEFKLANPTHEITGNLTMRDTTLSITFPAIVHVMGESVHAESKFNIDRTNWGVSYGDESKVVDKTKDKFIYNTVNVGFNIKATK